MLDSFPLAAASTACKIAQVTELHVRFAANLPIIDGEINGQGVQILLNTGGYRTFIGGETARRLHLPLRQYTDEQAYGLGGAVPVLTTIVNEFKLGEFTSRDVRFSVLDTVHNDPYGGSEFALGADFFSKFTTEFDLSHEAVRLLVPRDCQTEQLLYWDKSYFVTDLEPLNPHNLHFETYVLVNGQRLRAMFDSGAASSMISLQAAKSAGITPQSNATTEPATVVRGISGKPMASWIGKFDTFAIGNETIRNAKLQISGMDANDRTERLGSHMPVQMSQWDVIIGADFLRAHRVLISPETHKVFFTYTSGPVFQVIGTDQPQEAAQAGETASPPVVPTPNSP
jgi:predicted aspartyl protease